MNDENLKQNALNVLGKRKSVYKSQHIIDILQKLETNEEITEQDLLLTKEYLEDLESVLNINNGNTRLKKINNKLTTITMPNINNEYMNNTKIAKTISTNRGLISTIDNNINLNINVMPKLNIMTTVDLVSDSNVIIDSTIDITVYDMAVMDAIYTLSQVNCLSFTPQMICKVMSGNFKQYVTQKKIDKICNSIDKLRHIDIKIDCTEELEARKKKISNSLYNDNGRILLNSYLLPVEELNVKSGNQVTNIGFRLLEKPALYRYAECVNQIINIPIKLFQTQDELADNDEVILIKRYIIRKIALMTNDNNNITSNKIGLEWYDEQSSKTRGLYVELGYLPEDYNNWKEKKRKIREIIKGVLNNLKNNAIIKDYTPYKEAREIKGYIIMF